MTSRAVVASSATRIFGSFAIAIAIIARWRMPPENSCGYWRHRSLASGMPTRSSNRIVRARAAAAFDARPCARIVSSIWSPTDMTGLSDVFGSWKIIAMSLPRIGRSFSVESSSRFWPSMITAPVTFAVVRRSRPMAASQVTLLPEPGLADDAERLARIDVVGDVVDGVDDAVLGREVDGEVADLEDLPAAVARPIARSRRRRWQGLRSTVLGHRRWPRGASWTSNGVRAAHATDPTDATDADRRSPAPQAASSADTSSISRSSDPGASSAIVSW